MKKLIKSLQWLDENLLKIFLTLFIFLMPLYPKLPLKNVNYTYIAIRVDDLIVAAFVIVFFIQFLRRKVTLWTKYLPLFILFWLSVFLSFWYGMYVQKTIEIANVGMLNALRRVEYMVVFFIAASIPKSKKDFYYYLKTIFIVLALVCVYGIGQKFLGWPAVQTMNPEYAKGYLLYLDAYARISSTFAGHYDLAAYLVLLIPVTLSMFIAKNQKKYLVLFTLALLTIILSASRVSYGAYIISTVAFLLYQKKFRLLIFVLILTAVLTPLSANLTKRISRTFTYQKIYVDPLTNKIFVPKDMRPDDLPPGDYIFGKVGNVSSSKTASSAQAKDKSIDAVKAKEQIRESIIKEADLSGKNLTGLEIDAEVEKQFRSLIPLDKFTTDISVSTRLQVEWPRAFSAFMRNPILGKGPSSITESTDNDYLRWLGETGALGAGLFMLINGMIILNVWKRSRKAASDEKTILLGFVFGMLGILINATYIDVFEASKVAYTIWLMSGLYIATEKILPVMKSYSKTA